MYDSGGFILPFEVAFLPNERNSDNDRNDEW